MARFYRVSSRMSKKEADQFAESLAKELKKYHFPHETKVLKNGAEYVIVSTATISQVLDLQRWKNTEGSLKLLKKAETELDKKFRKHLNQGRNLVVKSQKEDMKFRKQFVTTRVRG
jgi:hypothetical protein